MSAGRVQTVAVRLIVEREKEIESFTPQEFWEIFCRVKSEKVTKDSIFIVKLVKINGKKATINNKKSATKVIKDLKVKKYTVAEVKTKEVKRNPFPPFKTSTLSQTAARAYFWSTKRTMSLAQKLYEEGLITYHRTDSTNLSKDALSQARSYIQEKYGKKYLPESARIYKTKAKVAQEAHEAIRPTKASLTRSKIKLKNGLTANHTKLYELIWKRFVASQMNPSIYEETTIEVEAKAKRKNEDSDSYLLRISGQNMIFDGWRVLFGNGNSNSNSKSQKVLPKVKKGEVLTLLKVLSEQKFTEPPARYGEASLVKALEQLGIGRPSTYAPIISTIQLRNYVEKKEGKFHPTPVGVTVNDFLLKHFPKVFDYEFTAKMEDDLDKVADGKAKWNEKIGVFWSPFDKKLEKVLEKAKRVKIEAEKLGRKCPTCKDGELVIRIGRFGKFVSCSKFPDCKHTERFIEKIGKKCPDCEKGDIIVRQTKKRRRFYGCSRYPKCEWASWRKPR